MVAGKTERPASLTAMRDWLVRQDVAAAAFPTEASRKTFRETLAAAAARPAGDGLFAPVREPNPSLLDVFGSTSNLYAVAHDLFTTSPGLSNLAFSAEAVGVGIRLDESLNVLAGLRMSWPKAGPGRESIAKVGPDGTVPVLHREDEFILSGAGALPRPVVVAAMEAYSARMIDDLRRDSPRSKLDQAAIAGFRQACEQAAGEVNSLAVYLPIGAEQEGVSTNQYLAVRASSAEKFVERTAEAMRRWNELNGGAEPSTGIVFDAKHVQLGNRSATQYSLDVVASIGGEDTSEMKRVMERLFGPDRKLHLWVVPVDAQTALLMQGTPQQAAKAVDSLADTSRRIDWNKPNVVRTNALLNSNEAANWKLFFSPQGYVRQQEREEDAAGPGIGRTVRKVDDSPPIGMAAGFGDGSLWIDVSAPVETVKAVYKFTHSRPQ